ncbi:MAG: gamma carbonic anhydrase family protein [Aquabacterium sp.]
MAVYRLEDRAPELHASAWVAGSADLIGHVAMAADSSVWYGAVLRGDNDWIRIGRASNVQDNSVLHTDNGRPLIIGEGVTIGHQVVLHSCTIGDDSLVGIQSVILNGARIGRHSIVGAGSLVPEDREYPDGVLILGRPAKVVRDLTPEQIERLRFSAQHYVEQALRHRVGGVRIDG